MIYYLPNYYKQKGYLSMASSLNLKTDLLIFDVDGVLIDTSMSYPLVVAEAIRWVWKYVLDHHVDAPGFTLDHFYATKVFPPFNDDYDIAWSFLCATLAQETESLLRSAPSLKEWKKLLETSQGMDIEEWEKKNVGDRISRLVVRRICEELYYGAEKIGSIMGESPLFITSGKGYWREEKPQISMHWSDLSLPVGIYTGRSKGEMKLALQLLGWEDLPEEQIITPESGITKPSPQGIARLCTLFEANNPIFFGDTESDRQALLQFGKGQFIAIGALLPHWSMQFNFLSEALSFLKNKMIL